MNATAFTQQVKAMAIRLGNLFGAIGNDSAPSSTLLPTALKELGVASEQLQIAATLIVEQSQQLLLAEQLVSAERQRYQNLLEFIPDACLVTNTAGVIQQANSATAKLLDLPLALLTDRCLTNFIAPESRPQFQAELQRLQQRPWQQEWQVQLQSYRGVNFNASVLVDVCQNHNQPAKLRWLFRHISQQQPSSSITELNYPLRVYQKGETIPLSLEEIWQVRSGLVKLTTFSQVGQEILIGLAGASAPFGPGLTALPLYEATALTDTQLWCIPLSDYTTSPELQQRLLPHISQRLKQSELLLTVYGQLRVGDRLYNLLQLLKQEVGQPVADGIRLGVRLTHEDLATACCTTRVTITRLLRQLQQQQKLRVDSQHHLVLLENNRFETTAFVLDQAEAIPEDNLPVEV